MSSKGKKKQGKVMSLSEFHATTPDTSNVGGPGSVGVPAGAAQPAQLVRINWADEMEKLDDTVPPGDFVFDRSTLPTAPKSTLAPDIDLELVPKQPPYTAYISNVSFEADESKIRAFFRDSNILNVRLPLDERRRFKGQGFIDFADRESLITALQKNEQMFFNRPMKVSLDIKFKQGQYGNATGDRGSDEPDWRSRPPTQDSSGPLKSFSFHNDPTRQGGGKYVNREGFQRRNNYNNTNRGSGGDREQNSWSHVNNREGGHPQEGQRPPRRTYQKYDSQSQRPNIPRNEGNESAGNENLSGSEATGEKTTTTTTETTTTRPKLKLAPRTLPMMSDASETPVTAAPSIFGSARPVNTAAREREIEEKLQREREQAAQVEATAEEAAATSGAEETCVVVTHVTAPVAHHQAGTRSHKTSVSSDHREGEFQIVGGHHQQQHHGGGGGKYRTSGERRGGERGVYKNTTNDSPGSKHPQKLATSESFTSGGTYHSRGGNKQRGGGHYQQDRLGQQQQHHRQDHSAQAPPRTENQWKTKQSAAELFSSPPQQHSDAGPLSRGASGSTRTSESHAHNVGGESGDAASVSSHLHQRRVNPNNGNRERKPGEFQSSRPRAENNRRQGGSFSNRGGGKQLTNRQSGVSAGGGGSDKSAHQPRQPRADLASLAASTPAAPTKTSLDESGFNNKFAHLKLDAEDIDDHDDDDEDDDGDEEDLDDDEQHQQQVEA